ncbi:hypothetical protein LTR94_035445, partial [Friedmanniomyces endolithicus]
KARPCHDRCRNARGASRCARHSGSRSHHPHQRRAAPVEFPDVAGRLQRTRVRADPLEWAQRLRCARRRTGQSGGRSGVGRARVQAHAGAGGTVRRGLAWLHPEPHRTEPGTGGALDA